MAVDRVSGLVLHAREDTLEAGVSEDVGASAAPADEMMVVLSVGQDQLIARGALSEVEGVQQAELDE